jgi:hypothetical protein
MHFQAIKADLNPRSLTDYVRVGNVKCPTCPELYQLWAPMLETEESEVQAQTTWMLEYLAKNCPIHTSDVIRTPDRP